MKTCKKCLKSKPETEFFRHPTTADRLRSSCKQCHTYRQYDRSEHPIPIEKPCPRCKKTLPAQSFNSLPSRKSGLSSWCSQCQRSRASRTNYERYGLSEIEYTELVATSAGRCAICKREETLVIDHCHVGGQVRGLLCNSCNIALGHMKDDPSRLRAAAQYLEDVP